MHVRIEGSLLCAAALALAAGCSAATPKESTEASAPAPPVEAGAADSAPVCPADAALDAEPDGCAPVLPIGCYPGAPCLFPGAACTAETGPCGQTATFACQSDLTFGAEVDQCTLGTTCDLDAGCGSLRCTCTGTALLCNTVGC